jgi:hypothetical protein
MIKTLSALVAVAVLSSPAASASLDSIESLRAGAAAPVAAPARKAFKASRYVSLHGWIDLRGNTHVREGDTFVRVNLSGSTTLNGAGARTSTVWVNEYVTIRLRKGQTFINETVYVSEYVSVYDRGRYVGSTNVSGSVRVSGRVSGNWLRLSGSGSLRGSLFVREPR